MEHLEQITDDKLQFESLPNHWKKNPMMLVNTLMSVREYAPHLEKIAEKIIPKLPRKLKASQNIKTDYKDKGSYLFPLNQAIDCPWISWDSAKFWNVLALDVDHSDGLTLWEELPEHIRPFLVVDPYSLRSAALFFLKTPVLVSSFSQLLLGEMAQSGLAQYFNATALPHTTLTKNPFGLKTALLGNLKRRTKKPTGGIMWDMFKDSPLVFHTLPGNPAIELRDVILFFGDDLESAISPRPRPEKLIFRNRSEPSDLGRNCKLFDLLRGWCYDNKISEMGEIMQEARNLNEGGLSESELRSISRSISKFMRTRYKPGSVKKKVMKLSASLDTKTKQKLSAMRTSDIHRDNTDHKIKTALKHWPEGEPITQSTLSHASGVSLRTIKRRWPTLNLTP